MADKRSEQGELAKSASSSSGSGNVLHQTADSRSIENVDLNEKVDKLKHQTWSLDRLQTEYVDGHLRLTSVIDAGEDYGEVMCLKFNSEGNMLAAGYANGEIKVYSPDGTCLHECLKLDLKTNYPVTSIKFLPSLDSIGIYGRLLMATYASGHIAFWHHCSLSSIIAEKRTSGETSNAAFNQSGCRIVSVGPDPKILVYDVETKMVVSELEASGSLMMMNGHRNRVYAVRFEPGSEHNFITGGWDNTIQFWDSRQKGALRHIYGPHICGDAIDIDPSGREILTGSWRNEMSLEIWDFASGKKIGHVPDTGYQSLLYSAQWYGKDGIACAGSHGNLGRIIERCSMNTLGSISRLKNGVFCMDNDGQGERPKLAFGSGTKIYVTSCTAYVKCFT